MWCYGNHCRSGFHEGICSQQYHKLLHSQERWELKTIHEFSSLVIIRTLVKTIWSLVLKNLKFEWNTHGDIIRRNLFVKEQRDVFGSSPWVEKIPWRREWLRFPIFLPLCAPTGVMEEKERVTLLLCQAERQLAPQGLCPSPRWGGKGSGVRQGMWQGRRQ